MQISRIDADYTDARLEMIESGDRGQRSEVRDQRSEVGDQRSEVRDQRAEAGPPKGEARRAPSRTSRSTTIGTPLGEHRASRRGKSRSDALGTSQTPFFNALISANYSLFTVCRSRAVT